MLKLHEKTTTMIFLEVFVLWYNSLATIVLNGNLVSVPTDNKISC